MAEEAAKQVTGSYQSWISFLKTVGRLYKYPYSEQLMIHAQRPDATACAEYDFWNNQWGRYIRRGSKGIALIDTSGDNPRLRYVFDVADTGTRENSRAVRLWEYRDEHADSITAMLERNYDVNDGTLRDRLERVATQLADEYWQTNRQDILDNIEDSYLEEYDDLNIEAQFESAATVSITYALMSRCGLEPDEYFEHEDFLSVFDFNTPATVAALGTAVSEISQQVLRQIEITIRNYEREHSAERTENNGRTDLHEERRLPDPGRESERDGEQAPREVRENAERVPEGAQTGAVESDDSLGEPVPASAGDRRDGEPEAGADDARNDGDSGRDGEPERDRSSEVDGADEQPESTGGGDHPARADFQLNPAAQMGEQLSLFPSEDEQIQMIDGADVFGTPAPFAMSIPQEDIDHILRLSGNVENGRMVIATEFSKGKSTEQLAEYLKSTFHGGNGIIDGDRRFAAWYADDGIHFASGSAARYMSSAYVLPWEDAARRISEMLETGIYASNVELAEMQGHERSTLALSLLYLYYDLSEEAHNQGYLSVMEQIRGGGYPDETERLSDRLTDTAFRNELTEQFAAFWAARESDRSLLRFNYHDLSKIYESLRELSVERREFSSDMAEIPPVGGFITEDEINDTLSGGSGVSGGKGRIYSFFSEPHSTKEQADFLKNEYGIGGRSHAVSGASHSGEDHSGKGIRLQKANCVDVEMNWNAVAKRISALIAQDRYLSEDEKAQIAAIRESQEEPEQHPATQAEPEQRPITQDDIDDALRAWNGDIDSKHAVVRYMEAHAREKDTAAWLSREYGGDENRPLMITRSGSDESVELSWAKVQRRIAQLIQNDDFYTDTERDNFDDIDPVAVRENLENGSSDAFVEQVLADVQSIAAEQPVLSPERMEQITEAFEAAGLSYDDIDSYGGYLVFLEEGGGRYSFDSWEEAAEWIDGVVFDDPARSEAAERVMHPERFTPGDEPFDVAMERELAAEQVTEDQPHADIIRSIEAAGYQQDTEIDYGSMLIFHGENGEGLAFTSWDDAAEWVAERESEIQPVQLSEADLPYKVGDTVYLEDQKPFVIEEIGMFDISLRDPSLLYPVWRSESRESFAHLMERFPQPEQASVEIAPEPENFRITDDHLGEGGAKAKFRMNMDAIHLLKRLETDGRQATPDEQEILSKYVGWGGLAEAFDETKDNWQSEYKELLEALTPEEYAAARASTLNAHYTSPTVIKAIYEAVENMGFQSGNILEPSMGVGNFFGLLPEEMSASKLYGVELDSITGRIAKQLYPNADITVAGFEATDRRDFYDLAVGNVPFGNYQVNDRAYNKLGFSIHDYFFAKALDQVRPGGVIAFVTSRYTMDKQSPEVRKYLAERADLLGAIRLPNNAFHANAGTDVVSDIIFLQKRDHPITIEPDWVHLGQNEDGFGINSYFVEHPEMILGRQTSESTQYGKQDFTVEPIEGADLAAQLHEAIQNIHGTYQESELPDLGEGEEIDTSIPADPNVKNFSYTVVDGDVYYRENSRMVKPDLNATATERVKGMVELRDCVQKLIGQQMDGFISDETIRETQGELNRLYDSFTAKYGLINSRGNALAFADDSSYYLLCSLEVLDEDNNLKRKADMFTKRTIKPHEVVTSVDTASEALALSISEKACVDMAYMSSLTGKTEQELADDLRGVIYMDFNRTEDGSYTWRTADDFLSGNVREKLAFYENALSIVPESNAHYEEIAANVEALRTAQPKDLDASEIEVRLGATWIDKEYIRQFMLETFEPPYYLRRMIDVNYSPFSAEWNITNKSNAGRSNIAAFMTYGTDRANAYKILEDTLNLRDVRIYDTVTDPDGKERRVLNSKETTLAQQKQQAIKDAFKDWIWRDPDRRQTLVKKYNELFNSNRPREYDGSHITFSGMNPEIQLREHQLNAVAHILYGGNTLLAHEVGAGKTFEMVAAAMESKRLGLCEKPLFAVPNHLTEQWAGEFLRLYPSANILVATKKDFEPQNRKKFCARIATGNYDAVIIGHSQFEKIPVSKERQERLLQEQIAEIEEGIEELKYSRAEKFTIKQLEKTKKGLETRLKKLQDDTRKDDVVTFEQLGVDRLYVDEAHAFKNLFLYTKMRNVAGLSTSDAQKSSDMLLKCRYIDEITDSKGVVFATGTPVSNSMTELYTMMRYLQHDTIQQKGLAHFDCWASTFGETNTAIELAPEGTGYRARTRFSKFFNLPELMTLFKEVADIKTSDQLHLPTPTPIYHNVVAQPTEMQKGMVQELSKRAAKVHAGAVDASVDNMLKITSDGRKLGLDQRVINPDLPDDPNSKVNMCVDNIAMIYQEGQADKLTQLVFCDLSTPKTTTTQRAAKSAAGSLDNPELNALERMLDKENEDSGSSFTIYEDLREKLVAKGIPRDQIAFIHEANTETRKKELYAKVRSGQVRVLMGSTFKMGSGMNVQDRLIALHDLDCPWRPGDLEQRAGRIIRQGNMNPKVHIFRYVTESTFDAYLWQTVENKQKFISQIMTSKSPVRSCDDIDETALSYAEIKALCAGDPRIKEKMDLDVDVARLKLMKANHQSQQYRLEDNLLKYFPEEIERNKGFIQGFTADMKTLAEHPHPEDGFAGMEVKGDILTDKDNAGAAILEAFKDVKGLEPVQIGTYRGFQMFLTLEDFGRDYILTLKGQMSHRVELGKDARGNLIRMDNVLNGMENRMKTVQDKLDSLYSQMEAAKAEIGKPFPQEEELRTKTARLAELNTVLNIDERSPIEQASDEPDIEPETAKQERPSVLAKLKSFSEQCREQPLTPQKKERETL